MPLVASIFASTAILFHIAFPNLASGPASNTRKQDAKWMLVHDQHISSLFVRRRARGAALAQSKHTRIYSVNKTARVCTKHISSRSRFCLFRRREHFVCVFTLNNHPCSHPLIHPCNPVAALRANFIFALDKAEFAAVNKLALAKTSRWWRLRFWCTPHERVTGFWIGKKREISRGCYIPSVYTSFSIRGTVRRKLMSFYDWLLFPITFFECFSMFVSFYPLSIVMKGHLCFVSADHSITFITR
jgi:hypothetical protein